MSEELRQLFYPLGFISSLAFTLRFLVQWIYSESQKKSAVNPLFWMLSFLGNVALAIHSGIQLQYPICVIQALNAVISLRNINLMGSREKMWRLKTVFIFLVLGFLIPTIGFLLGSPTNWLRIPTHTFILSTTTSVSFFWHALGSMGVFLFALRFWLQWIDAEKKGASYLGETFWWLSLLGAVLSLAYFFHIGDLVNVLGPLFGIIPYVRNLMLLKSKKAVYEN